MHLFYSIVKKIELKLDESLGINESKNPKILTISGHYIIVKAQIFFMQLDFKRSTDAFRNITFDSKMAF